MTVFSTARNLIGLHHLYDPILGGLSFSLCLAVYFLCLQVCLSVYLCFSPNLSFVEHQNFLILSVCPSVCLSVCLPHPSLSLCLSVCLSLFCVSVHLCVSLPTSLSLSLSVCLLLCLLSSLSFSLLISLYQSLSLSSMKASDGSYADLQFSNVLSCQQCWPQPRRLLAYL